MSAQIFMDAMSEINVKYVEEVLTYQRSAKRKTTRMWLKGCVAACLVLLISFGTVLAINTDARAAFVGWIKEICGTYFVYRFDGDAISDVEPVAYRPTWLPEGYTEFFLDDTEDTVIVAYSNEAGNILRLTYIHNPDETVWFVDKTHVTIERTHVNGNEAELLISTDADTASGIMWIAQDNTAFLISAFLNESELIQVAESVKEE